ncbi:seizure protein 6 homolog isoform X2 [Hemicordylus capensis]|uniref:seizure protein 6 homolog isoform X2 n=1 Tax=Hemicordylus capensis TaxID=884348 RepID=UPI0023036778|nr:seizure protein 6 homolog isoform X2 [Hemicordylus capensis]
MKGSPALCLLLAALLSVRAQGLSPEEPDTPGSSEADGERTVPPTPDEMEHEARFVTTAPTLKLLNHHPLLEDFLHEALLKKDYLEQIPFLAAGLVGPGPVLPDTGLAPASTNHVAGQDGRPALRDVTTAPTTLPMAPVATAGPTTLEGKKTRGRDVERSPEMAKPAFTTDLLTTAMGRLVPWAKPGRDVLKTVPLSGDTQLPPVTPALAFSQAGRPNSDPATAAILSGDNPNPTAPTVPPRVATLRPVSSKDEETATTTITTTTVVTIVPASGPCNWNLTGPEGSLASPLPSGIPYEGGALECAYTISVYPGYGVEIRVQNISLVEGETVTVETLGGVEPVALANESFLMRGQVIRGPTNQVLVRFQSPAPSNPGTFHFHFQAYLLSCVFPTRPAYGDVSVTSLHPGGSAYFSCANGYQLQGQHRLACLNATHPFWNSREPTCVAACGGVIRNATVGRIMSPGFPANYSNNLTCHWLLEAPPGQQLHLHFEKVSLAEDDDRLIIRNGNNIEAPPVYDSYEVEYLPIEGLISTARGFFIELTTDSSGVAAGMALRYEAFEAGHCYEPFVKYGNFTTSDATYAVGSTVEFACEAGYTLEQGSVIIECVDPTNPQWNETEPACRAVCSGEITDAVGVVLSPNWPEPYGKGQDCIWGLHVEEDKRIMLDIKVLRLGKGDVLTFYDGDDLTARILGQYSGPHQRFKLYTSMADVTIQFQSDPGSNGLGYQQGFIIHFAEVPRNDTCPELPEIPNGWKTMSHPELIHGTVVTYHCYPGYELLGTELLMCHWDLTWSGDLPSCQRVTTCRDPGDVDHSRRVVSSNKFPVGSTIQFVCDKGYALAGSGAISCHDRQAGGPKWSDRLPKCIPEVYEPCHNPGLPDHGTQTPERRVYQAGATLRFSCASGYLLLGEATLRCVPGHPSQWNGSPPLCKAASYDAFDTNRNLDAVAKVAPATDPLQGTNVAFAVFLPVAAVGLLLGAVYLYISRNQGKPSLQLPLSGSHPYDHITVDSAFDNPTYEIGEIREYEVSI